MTREGDKRRVFKSGVDWVGRVGPMQCPPSPLKTIMFIKEKTLFFSRVWDRILAMLVCVQGAMLVVFFYIFLVLRLRRLLDAPAAAVAVDFALFPSLHGKEEEENTGL